jgi:predicted HTH domain antitoxin
MTLTLDIRTHAPQEDAEQREKLARAAIALYDARLVTQGQAAEMAGLSRADFIEALIRAGVSVIQYDSAEEILAEAALLPEHS